MKTLVSVIAVILTFAGYAPYVWDIVKKKTTPHAFTWFVWAVAGFVAWGLQVVGGAGVGAWALFSACVICFIIFILSLWTGSKNITFSDTIFLTLALVSLVLWLIVKQPVWSVILATGTEILGFIPTLRKSWNNPYSETLSLYEISFLRHGLSFFALQKINILTALYPVVWTIANMVFTIILVVRRSVIKKTKSL